MSLPILKLLDYVEKTIVDLDNAIKKRSLRKTKTAFEKLTGFSNCLKESLPEDFIEENFGDFERHMHFIEVFLKKKDFGWIRSNFDDIIKEDFPNIRSKIYTFSGNQKVPEKRVVPLSNKVFIVHGRDETQALRLQKYLTKTLKVDAEMFEDFKEKTGSNTIIEQLEYIKNSVGYAFVIVTPDDLGCLREDIDKCRTKMLIGKSRVSVKSVCEILDKLHTRARQNVVFEHGLFIGALERDNVCCLLQKDTKEKPSDIDGILYVSFGKSVKDTFTEITEKLKKAGLVKT